jgi:hypothetical protein
MQTYTLHLGRAMAQAVNRRSPTAESRVRSLVILCGICGRPSGTVTGFPPSTSVFPRQFHPTGAPLLGKMKTKLSLSQGCRLSLKAAVRP